jgi:hypothetical protein
MDRISTSFWSSGPTPTDVLMGDITYAADSFDQSGAFADGGQAMLADDVADRFLALGR